MKAKFIYESLNELEVLKGPSEKETQTVWDKWMSDEYDLKGKLENSINTDINVFINKEQNTINIQNWWTRDEYNFQEEFDIIVNLTVNLESNLIIGTIEITNTEIDGWKYEIVDTFPFYANNIEEEIENAINELAWNLEYISRSAFLKSAEEYIEEYADED